MVNRTIYNDRNKPSTNTLVIKKSLKGNSKFDVTTQQVIETHGTIPAPSTDHHNFNLWRRKNRRMATQAFKEKRSSQEGSDSRKRFLKVNMSTQVESLKEIKEIHDKQKKK